MTPYTPINGQLPFKAAKKFIIDCDCGPDDAHALILAFHMAKKLNKEILGNKINFFFTLSPLMFKLINFIFLKKKA